MSDVPMIDAGYALKRIVAPSSEAPLPGVREILSVSGCISKTPDRWVQGPINALMWFNTVADAMSVVPQEEWSEHRLFAYRLAPLVSEKGELFDSPLPEDVKPDPIGPAFVERGFDAASELDGVWGYLCSPLSCNNMARQMRVNEWCLFPTRAEAEAAAKRFSLG